MSQHACKSMTSHHWSLQHGWLGWAASSRTKLLVIEVESRLKTPSISPPCPLNLSKYSANKRLTCYFELHCCVNGKRVANGSQPFSITCIHQHQGQKYRYSCVHQPHGLPAARLCHVNIPITCKCREGAEDGEEWSQLPWAAKCRRDLFH